MSHVYLITFIGFLVKKGIKNVYLSDCEHRILVKKNGRKQYKLSFNYLMRAKDFIEKQAAWTSNSSWAPDGACRCFISVVPGLECNKRSSRTCWRKPASPRCTGQCHSNPQHICPRRIWHPRQFCTMTHCYRSWPRLWYHLFWPRPSCICPFRMHRLILCCCLFSVHPLSRSYLCQCTRSTWGQKLKWNLRENETLARKIKW